MGETCHLVVTTYIKINVLYNHMSNYNPEFVPLEDLDEEEKISSEELGQFYRDLGYIMDQKFDKYDLDSDRATLVGVGGSSCMMYNTDQKERKANDIDFMVVHPDESINSPQSYLEAIAINEALNDLGFEFTTGKPDRTYDQTYEGTQTLENVNPEMNSVSVDRVDIIGGETPFGTYTQDWLTEYSENLTDDIAVLELEAITARKILRKEFANQGNEDDEQLHDIDHIRENLGNLDFDCDRFRDCWDDLVEQTEIEASYSDAKKVLVNP